MADYCPWSIRWTFNQDIRCGKKAHKPADSEHRGVVMDYAYPGSRTEITWQAGDRREFTGDWPGPCPKGSCTLHAGHHGRCAP
jgi:hypothetical protein